MKGIGVALALLVAAYLADQTFSHGKYSDAALRMIAQMRHSFGGLMRRRRQNDRSRR